MHAPHILFTLSLSLQTGLAFSSSKLGSLLGGAKSTPRPPNQPQHFDLVVIGGGSGGLAASKEAALLGKKVCVCDFVKASPAGSKWGLGGTCVNVGCIPKKLMHQAALLGEARKDSVDYGWSAPEQDHSWETLVNNVQMYVKSMNFAYRSQCFTNKVDYKDAFATFVDESTVETVNKKGEKQILTADQFLICTGGRPKYLPIPGALEHCITSDDIFSMRTPPGKTLVVGASYVALECAGFLHGLGFETTVMMRSIPLRGFDQEMAAQIVKHMKDAGIEFIEESQPTNVELLESGRKRVSWSSAGGASSGGGDGDGSEEYDTVMLAVGRDAYTGKLGLENCGVTTNPKTGKIPTVNEQTNVPHIYAIGDVIDGEALDPPSSTTELTPVAIQAGRLLANRLYGTGARHMDYQTVPTTVFTPLEYGCVGLSEEEAIAKHGAENIEVYHRYFKPLEWRIVGRRKESGSHTCFAKIITHISDDERVLGLHVCGPNAGELTQGFAVAMRCGATKADFDETIGIHPTMVETFTTMDVTKRSGESAEAKTC